MPNYLKKLLGSDFKDEMTMDDIAEALEKQNLVPKSKLDKARSEVADLKKQARQTLSEEEKKSLETQELIEQLQSTNETLKRENSLNKYTNQFLSQGYDKELAIKSANAMLDNDMDTIFECQNTFLADREAKLKKDILDGTTAPKVSEGDVNTVQATQNKVDKLLANGDRMEAMLAMEQLQNK